MKNEYKAGHEDGVAEGKIEGKIEDIIQLLKVKFDVSDTLLERIKSIDNEDFLSELFNEAIKAESTDDIISKIDKGLSGQVKSTIITD